MSSISAYFRIGDTNAALILQMAQVTLSTLIEQPIFGNSDLLANIGGYLGLCLGASFLSLYDFGAGVFKRLRERAAKKMAIEK